MHSSETANEKFSSFKNSLSKEERERKVDINSFFLDIYSTEGPQVKIYKSKEPI